MLAALLALAAIAHPAPKVTLKMPTPGGVELRVLKIDAKLRPGTKAPQHLVLKASGASKLPASVAVVGTIRRLRHAPAHHAVYLGLVAAFRSQAPASARAADDGRDDVPDALAGILSLGSLEHHPEIKVTPRVGFHIETRRNRDTDRFEDVLVPDGYQLQSRSSTGEPHIVPVSEKLGDVLDELKLAQGAIDKLGLPSAFDDRHAFSWTVSGDSTSSTAPADNQVIKDILELLDGKLPVAEVTGDLLGPLNKIAPGRFGAGALSPSLPPAKHVVCRVSSSFTIVAPPSNGLSFEGPPVLDVPMGALDPRGTLTDTATKKAPTPAPWTGVRFKTSYEGRARTGDDPADHWEYVIQFNGSGSGSQPLGPNRTWSYAVTYTLEADACPQGSKPVR